MINFPRQSSIRRRLVFLLLMGSATLAFLLYFVVQSVARQAAQESQDNILAASAVSILDGVKLVDGQTDVDMPYSSLSMLDSVTDERVFYAIYLDANLLTGYPELIKLQTNTAMVPVFSFGTLFDVDVRIVTVKSQIGKNEVFVSVAQTLNGQIKVLRNISSIALGVGFGFFVLSAILAFLIAESTIKPLNRLTLSVSRRGPDELRPVSAPVPSEMVPLVNSLNNFMTRLKLSLQRSEEFIAEILNGEIAIEKMLDSVMELANGNLENAQELAQEMYYKKEEPKDLNNESGWDRHIRHMKSINKAREGANEI